MCMGGEAFSETHSFPPPFKKEYMALWLAPTSQPRGEKTRRNGHTGTTIYGEWGGVSSQNFFRKLFFGSRDGSQFFFAKPLSHKLPQLAAAATQYDTWNPTLPPTTTTKRHIFASLIRTPFSATISLGHIDLRPLLRLSAKSSVREEVEISRRIS